MGWPQVVMVVLIVLGLGANISKTAADRTISSGRATALILFYIGYYVGFIALLCVGGFW